MRASIRSLSCDAHLQVPPPPPLLRPHGVRLPLGRVDHRVADPRVVRGHARVTRMEDVEEVPPALGVLRQPRGLLALCGVDQRVAYPHIVHTNLMRSDG